MIPVHDVHVREKRDPVASSQPLEDTHRVMLFRKNTVPERAKILISQIFELQFFGQLQEKILRLHSAALKSVPKRRLHKITADLLFVKRGITLQISDDFAEIKID